MVTFRKFPTVIFGLAIFSVTAAASDSALMNLAMPDAKVLVGANVSKILASPMAKQIASQIEGGNPQVQQLFEGTGFDPMRDIHEILVASTGQGHNPPTIVLVRGTFDVPKITAFVSSASYAPTTYEGVTVLESAQGAHRGQASGVAFLDNSTAVAGDLDQVRAAIRRRARGGAFHAALASKADMLSRRYDIWIYSAISMSDLATSVPNPNMRQVGDVLKSIQEVSGGMRLGPDMEIAAEMVTGSEKAANSLADSLRVLIGLMTMNQQGADGLKPEDLKLTVDARTVRVAVNITAEQLRKAYQTQMARNTLRPPVAVVHPQPVDGGITIQSSSKDMGTVVVKGKGE